VNSIGTESLEKEEDSTKDVSQENRGGGGGLHDNRLSISRCYEKRTTRHRAAPARKNIYTPSGPEEEGHAPTSTPQKQTTPDNDERRNISFMTH
jgi:hypothetical protein